MGNESFETLFQRLLEEDSRYSLVNNTTTEYSFSQSVNQSISHSLEEGLVCGDDDTLFVVRTRRVENSEGTTDEVLV